MNQPAFFRRILPHLVIIVSFLVLAALYAPPALQGKVIPMHDVQQAQAGAHELQQYTQETNLQSGWTNSMFAGMPAYMIAFNYPNTFVGKAGIYAAYNIPMPISLLFLMMVGMYMLLYSLGIRGWLAALGAIAFSFGSFNIIIIPAGHVSKVLALAYAPGLLGGIILCLRGRYWIGAAITGFFLNQELSANHIQITYYVFLAIVIYVITEAVVLLRSNQAGQLLKAAGVLAVTGLLGVGSYAGRLLVLNDFSKETIRGRSELTQKVTGAADSQRSRSGSGQNGLDKEYAFNWSYGKTEILTLLIPNVYGGKTNGGLTDRSELYQAMTSKGVEAGMARNFVKDLAPVYWGDQPSTAGPAYAGAVVLFLFILGCLIVPGRLKWWALGLTLFYISIAFGKNLMAVNGLLFDYFPLFNKFRAVTMSLNLAQLFIALLAVLALREVASGTRSATELNRSLLISFVTTGGLALLLALFGSSLFSFRRDTDEGIMQQVFGPEAAADMLHALIQDRQLALRNDAFRSFFFVLLAAGAAWLFIQSRLKAAWFYPLITFLTLADLFTIDKRYLNNGTFVRKAEAQVTFEPTPADQQILQDKALSFRVLDNTVPDFTSDARASYFHKSLGGYHAAKLKRYSELVQYIFPKNSVGVVNMLNAKYIIQANPQGGPPQAQHNPEALGNAWFVQAYRLVPDADSEVLAMQQTNPRDTAVVDQRFGNQLQGLVIQRDSVNTIQLTDYKPDRLTYRSHAKTEQLAVFSEIYYKGETDWNAYVDGKKVPHLRVDYVLRGLRVSAGDHAIEFRFEPPIVAIGNQIDLVCNLSLIAMILGAVVLQVRQDRLRSQQSV